MKIFSARPERPESEDDSAAATSADDASGNSGDPSSASREHAITHSPRGVLTITGGKLTTYRAMAEQCVD